MRSGIRSWPAMPRPRPSCKLCMYSDLLRDYQGLAPAEMHLALGGVKGETVSLRVADYAAYYRLAAREFETSLNETAVHPLATVS